MTITFTKGMEYSPQNGDWFVWQNIRSEREDELWTDEDGDDHSDEQVLDLLNADIITIYREEPGEPYVTDAKVVEWDCGPTGRRLVVEVDERFKDGDIVEVAVRLKEQK